MFAKLEDQKTNSRFKNNPQLQNLDLHLGNLKEKQAKFKTQSKSELSKKKYLVLSNFLTKIDDLIALYNKNYKWDLSISEDRKDQSDLLIGMLQTLATIRAEEWETLFTPRNYQGNFFNTAFKYSTLLVGSAAGTATLVSSSAASTAIAPAIGIGLFAGGIISTKVYNKLFGGEKKNEKEQDLPETASFLMQFNSDILVLIRQMHCTMGSTSPFSQRLNSICLTPLDVTLSSTLVTNHAIKPENLYIYPLPVGNSFGCAYKTKNNKILRLQLSDYLDPWESKLLLLNENESLTIRHYAAINAAIYRIFCAPTLNQPFLWQGIAYF